jgi:hypothetical protein
VTEAVHLALLGDATGVTGAIDLTNADDHRRVRRLADHLLDRLMDDSAESDEQLQALAADDGAPLDARVAGMLALSKIAVRRARPSGTIAVIFAMWGEHHRLQPRTRDNPTGEDALRVKLDQLDWLLADSDVTWQLLPVDDGCPHGSAAIAAGMAEQHPLGDRVTVLSLPLALPAAAGPLAGLASADDSRKGGALVLGALHALAHDADAVVFTDADNSVDLAQLGLLLEPWTDGAPVVLGDRKSGGAVLVKQEDRWGPGIVVLRHLQRMVGRTIFSRGILDTQAAFKLYDRAATETILGGASVYDFSVDTDWILGAIDAGCDIRRVPFAFIDSFAESASIAQGPMTTWESLLVGLVTAVRARGAEHDPAAAAVIDEFARADTLDLVVANVPPELDGVDPGRLGDPDLMPPDQVAAWIRSLRP